MCHRIWGSCLIWTKLPCARVCRGRPRVRHDASSFLPFPNPHIPFGLSRITEMTCASDNTQAVDQSHFWSGGSIHWDAHRVGWAVAGACTVVVRVFLYSSCSWLIKRLLDSVNLCCICSSTLSVRYDLTTSDGRRSHAYRRNYTKRAEQRQMYVPYSRRSRSYLIF